MKTKFYNKIGFGILVVGFYTLVENEMILSTNVLTIIIQSIAFCFMVWARITFGFRSFHASANTTKGELIQKGPYRIVRHPIYTSILFFFIGSLVAYPNPDFLLGFGFILSGLGLRIYFEEKSLFETYKEAYSEYARKTKRILPFVF